MEYGEKIAALRKGKGMTQAELGNELNVTYQAVSKWERGESEPDFGTLSKMAKIFGVPITYFEDGEISNSAAQSVSPAAATPPAMLGVCTVCGKVVYEGQEGSTEPALVCADCVTRRAEAQEQAAKEKQLSAKRKREFEKAEAKLKRNKGLIVSGIINGVLLVFSIIGFFLNPENLGEDIGYTVLGLVFLYTFIAQLFWGGIIIDVILAGVKIIGTPGIIFTFDLDGFIFLIAMKILFAVIKILVLFICMAVCALAALIISPVTFIPAVIRLSSGNTDNVS